MRMQLNLGAILLLQGEPGGGKTEFAMAMAKHWQLPVTVPLVTLTFSSKYQCAPDRERDLVYNYDMNGIVTFKCVNLPGPPGKL